MQKAALMRFATLFATLGALVGGAFKGDFIWP
jgi:hypothetical protein